MMGQAAIILYVTLFLTQDNVYIGWVVYYSTHASTYCDVTPHLIQLLIQSAPRVPDSNKDYLVGVDV